MQIDLAGLEKVILDQYDPRYWAPVVTIRPAPGMPGSIYINTGDGAMYINTGKSMEKI